MITPGNVINIKPCEFQAKVLISSGMKNTREDNQGLKKEIMKVAGRGKEAWRWNRKAARQTHIGAIDLLGGIVLETGVQD